MAAMNNCWRVGKVVAWRKGFRLENQGADVSRQKNSARHCGREIRSVRPFFSQQPQRGGAGSTAFGEMNA